MTRLPDRSNPPFYKPLGLKDVSFISNRRARRYIARIGDQGEILITLPPRGSKREALAFVNQHREWIEKERRSALERVEESQGLRFGDSIWFRGESHLLVLQKDWGRPYVQIADQKVFLPDENADLAKALRGHLRALAKLEFPPRLRELAASCGQSVTRVSVRDQKTRWGSCSTGGSINLSWRLVLAPEATRDYVMLHELAHLIHFNHSPAFWEQVGGWCPDYRTHEKWLSDHQNEMRW